MAVLLSALICIPVAFLIGAYASKWVRDYLSRKDAEWLYWSYAVWLLGFFGSLYLLANLAAATIRLIENSN